MNEAAKHPKHERQSSFQSFIRPHWVLNASLPPKLADAKQVEASVQAVDDGVANRAVSSLETPLLLEPAHAMCPDEAKEDQSLLRSVSHVRRWSGHLVNQRLQEVEASVFLQRSLARNHPTK